MEFVKEYFINNYLYIQIIPIVFGVLSYSKLDKVFKLFIWVLVFSVATEIVKQYYKSHVDFTHNRILTNVYNIVYFLFVFYVFHKKLITNWLHKIIKCFILIYIASMVYELFFLQLDYFRNTQVIPYIIAGMGVVICVFSYLISVLYLDIEKNIFKDFLFWFVLAHFVYFLAYTPLKISENYFSLNNNYTMIKSIKIGATSLKTLFLSIGFLWTTYMSKK